MVDYLADVPSSKAFYFTNGSKARNLYELAQGINALDEETFKFHCNLDHDDFANWIGGVVGDIELSQKLREIKSKNQYLRRLNKHIASCEKKGQTSQVNRMLADQLRVMMHDYGHVIAILLVIVATSIFTAMIYFQYHSLQNLRALDERINYIEARNTCFNNYFNDQVLTTRELFQNQSFLDNYCVYNYSTSVSIPDNVLESRPGAVSLDDIKTGELGALIAINDSQLAIFANTSSMLPVINQNTKALEIKPKSASELHVGDIISFEQGGTLIVHRIVDIGRDAEGLYYITKGDNNNIVDPDKVRFKDVKGKVVVIIY